MHSEGLELLRKVKERMGARAPGLVTCKLVKVGGDLRVISLPPDATYGLKY